MLFINKKKTVKGFKMLLDRWRILVMARELSFRTTAISLAQLYSVQKFKFKHLSTSTVDMCRLFCVDAVRRSRRGCAHGKSLRRVTWPQQARDLPEGTGYLPQVGLFHCFSFVITAFVCAVLWSLYIFFDLGQIEYWPEESPVNQVSL